MDFAVVKINGKQHLVSAGDQILVNANPGKTGDKLEFGEVLLLSTDKGIEIGTPLVEKAKVVTEIWSPAETKCCLPLILTTAKSIRGIILGLINIFHYSQRNHSGQNRTAAVGNEWQSDSGHGNNSQIHAYIDKNLRQKHNPQSVGK